MCLGVGCFLLSLGAFFVVSMLSKLVAVTAHDQISRVFVRLFECVYVCLPHADDEKRRTVTRVRKEKQAITYSADRVVGSGSFGGSTRCAACVSFVVCVRAISVLSLKSSFISSCVLCARVRVCCCSCVSSDRDGDE